MRATSKLLALTLTAALQPAFANVLTFNDISTSSDPNGFGMVQLLDRYLKSDGVQFKDAAWGTTSYKCDGFGSFITRDGGCGALLLAGDPRDNVTASDPLSFTINFASGFTTGSSFYYSALKNTSVSVEVFDGLNGTGNGTLISGLQTSDCQVSGVTFCNWSLLNLAFTGTAYSIVIKGSDEALMLDDLSLIKATPTNPNPLPEPGSIALALGGLGALGWSRKRAAR